MGLTPCGKAIAQSADELTRIWRLARAPARQDVFPGLLDGAMHSFFTQAGEFMSSGGEPERVWSGVAGVIRCGPNTNARELTQEWAVAMEVLTAACESLDAAPEVGQWLARAVAEAEKGTASLFESPSLPEGIVRVTVFSELRPRRRRED